MVDFTQQQLIDYVSGCLDDETASKIDGQAPFDEELRSRLAILGMSYGSGSSHDMHASWRESGASNSSEGSQAVLEDPTPSGGTRSLGAADGLGAKPMPEFGDADSQVASECPSEETLAHYVANIAYLDDADSTATHLERCPRCLSAVEWLKAHPQPSGTLNSESGDNSGSAAGSGSQSRSGARFDPSIFGPAANDDALGTLGRYEIREVLGRGGMGVVFSALDMQLRRPVAIKILNQDLAASQIARRRFLREARAAAVINHANVVTIYSVEEIQNLPLLAMELIQGKSLGDYIRERKRLDPVEAMRITAEVADGLAAAHDCDVIHRDVKPSNIMLEAGGRRVKLTDFGLARAAIDNVELTTHDSAVGTPAYMAPEQVCGDEIDSRADLFALGCLIHAMLTGYSPFHGESVLQIAHKVTDWYPPALSTTHATVSPFLSDLVDKLLEKDPADRYQSAGEVAELLKTHLARVGHQADEPQKIASGASSRPAPKASQPNVPAYRRPVSWIVAAAAAVLLALLGLSRPWSTDDGGTLPPLPSGYSEITVAKAKDQADFDSIRAAIEHAGPKTRIHVLDAEVYDQPLRIADDRLAGLQIVSDQHATLTAPHDSDVIVIDATSDVVISGFRMNVALEQKGFEIKGYCPGLQIRDLEITRSDQSAKYSWALFHLYDGARGSAEHPIVIKRVKVRDGDQGINIGQGSADDVPPCGWIEVHHCDLAASGRRKGYHVVIASRVENVLIRENLFATAVCGVSLQLLTDASNITIEQNTFYDLGNFLVANEDVLAKGDIVFRGNLIASTGQPVYKGVASDVPPGWFDENYWLDWSGEESELVPIAQPLSDFWFKSTTRETPDYLMVAPNSHDVPTLDPFPGRYESVVP